MKKSLPSFYSVKDNDLRSFSYVFGVLMSLIFGVAFPYFKRGEISFLIIGIAIGIAVIGTLLPKAIFPLFFVMTIIGKVLGAINNRLLLLIIYVFFFVPYSLIIRIFTNKLNIQSSFDPTANSYRVLPTNKRSPQHMEKTF